MLQTPGSPLEYDGQRMPVDRFRNLWHTPGFKYEYSHGRANISVQRAAAPTVAATPSMIVDAVSDISSSLPDDVGLQSAGNASVEKLSALWLDVFVRTPDYYGHSVEDIRKEASETLDNLYHGESPDLHSASVIARCRGHLVGMLLVSETRTRPIIETLGVRPDVQRRGVGKAMAGEVAQNLQRSSEDVICSGYFLANAGSAGWHEATGFIEIPDWLTTQHRLRCARHNLNRGLVRDVFSVKRYVKSLEAKVEQMYQDRDNDPSAHSPMRWVKSDGDRIDTYLSDRLEKHEL